jgi:hypothetical protein
MCAHVVVSSLGVADGADGRRLTSTSRLYYETVGRTGPNIARPAAEGGMTMTSGWTSRASSANPSHTVAANAPRIAGRWAVGVVLSG